FRRPGDLSVRPLRRGGTPPAEPTDRFSRPPRPGRLALQALDYCGDPRPIADAHGAEAVTGILALELVQQGRDHPGAAGCQRMAQRDGAAIVVDLLHVSAGLLL